MLHISYSERTYSKESVVALFDTALNLSASDFSFYFDHYNNMPALLDAINFGEGFVEGSCIYLRNSIVWNILSYSPYFKRQYSKLSHFRIS